MHAISSYRGNRPTHTHTHPQRDRTAANAQCNHFCLDSLFVCDNVHTDYVSALVAAVCTTYCALQIVIFTLHYMQLTSQPAPLNNQGSKARHLLLTNDTCRVMSCH